VWVSHGSRGDLSISLSDPTRVESTLHVPHGDRSRFPSGGWTYSSARHWGQGLRGVWDVKVADATRNGISGSVSALQLTVYGHKKQ
jgi:subtilisin-like proprotein convertase family protein